MDNKFPEGVILTSNFNCNKILNALRPDVVLKEKNNKEHAEFMYWCPFLEIIIEIVRLRKNVSVRYPKDTVCTPSMCLQSLSGECVWGFMMTLEFPVTGTFADINLWIRPDFQKCSKVI